MNTTTLTQAASNNPSAPEDHPTDYITSWITSTLLPATVIYSQAIVTKNRVYLLGGVTGSGSYSSTLSSDL